ncbi:MAG: isoleucine--tRNA ligase [Candidatus Omnitrophica bacterium]|nr:isoleucine--tRNA ligase [Candidatus Omnitrophota bacterium]
MNYKDTLNLPKTGFSMKANLPQKEPGILKKWEETGVYAELRKARKGNKKFILHDGPPYANGHIHMGHVLNKILKDITLKFYSMNGFDSPFVPGWDCHGLPVEHQLFKELGISKYDISQIDFRKKAQDYALRYVGLQKEEFKRLGIFGRWEKPYLTLDSSYETAIVRSFGKLVKKGYIYRDMKPVNWCTKCETALAEAEVEYANHTSPSIYVKFNVKNPEKLSYQTPNAQRHRPTHLLIWTTTPWTLLANVAVAVHPDKDYVFLEAGNEIWVMLETLAESVMKKFAKPITIVGKTKGSSLAGVICEHPFIRRDSRVVTAGYVSSVDGTGCVHTAPGHGQEDYITGKKHNLPMIMPVDAKGNFDKTCEDLSGINVHEANPRIIKRLGENGVLLFSENITHSYPHCWRCKSPIIFRATDQYFMRIDHDSLRQKMLKAIKEKVSWHPAVGESRISAMVAERPDWCLSRQRYWGVPIIAFRCVSCKQTILDAALIEHVAKIVEIEGANAWFARKVEDLLPKGAKCPSCKNEHLAKENDIIDVWFESGVSHQAVLKKELELDYPCELYLEGSDQHRGWFQSSLITSCALDGSPAYRDVLTHGFVVDGEGKKMSKSLGNVISPEDVMKKYGADILRLWVASSDYNDDVRLSDEILARLADAYRKIRNTFKYILGNLYDFNPEKDALAPEKMEEIDRWMLSRLSSVINEVKENYGKFLFYKVFRSVYNFCVYEISSVYLDILKDRLYTFKKDSRLRRSAQTTLNEILVALIKILAPILPFTAEEAWQELGRCPTKEQSVHLAAWHWKKDELLKWKDEALDKKWSKILEIREVVLKALEAKRSEGAIGGSLDARVVLFGENEKMNKFLEENARLFPSVFITSEVEVAGSKTENLNKADNVPIMISVGKASGKKCARCWNYSKSVGTDARYLDICSRCVKTVS